MSQFEPGTVLDLDGEPIQTCVICGEYDGAPKVYNSARYFAEENHTDVYHLACTPAHIYKGLIGGAHNVNPLIVAKTFQAAREGKRNAELRGFILEEHAKGIKKYGTAEMIWKTLIGDSILDALMNGGASGTVTLGAQALTLPFKLKWMSTVSSATGSGTEWTGGSYVAGGVSMSGAWGTVAAALAKASTAAISVSGSPALTWADNEAADATGTPIPLWCKGTPSLAISVSSGSTATIPISSLTGATT